MKKLYHITYNIVYILSLLILVSCEKERLLVVNGDGSHYYQDEKNNSKDVNEGQDYSESDYINVPNTIIMVQTSQFGNSLTYSDAVLYCKGLNIGGFDDWRLPTRDEIILIYKYTKVLKSGVWWTSTNYLYGEEGRKIVFNADIGATDYEYTGINDRCSSVAVRNK